MAADYKEVSSLHFGMTSTSITNLSSQSNFYAAYEKGSNNGKLETTIGTAYQNVSSNLSHLNFYVKPGFCIGKSTVIYGKLGYGMLFGGSGSSNNSISYGAGVSYKFTKKLGIEAGYDNLYSSSGLDITQTKFGIRIDL